LIKNSKNYFFNKDIFLVTQNPLAIDSKDSQYPIDSGCTHDFTNGTDFALDLMKFFPGKKTLLDLGTATGTVPLSMRKVGLIAVGLEGSDAPRQQKLGAWTEYWNITATCNIGKPFKIIDIEGNPIIFDFVTAWGVIEHIPLKDIPIVMNNILNHTNKDSIIILNIDLGYNPIDGYHMLWKNHRVIKDECQERINIIRRLLSDFFIIDERLKKLTKWRYCRPTKVEMETNLKAKVNIYSGRSYWWLKKKEG